MGSFFSRVNLIALRPRAAISWIYTRSFLILKNLKEGFPAFSNSEKKIVQKKIVQVVALNTSNYDLDSMLRLGLPLDSLSVFQKELRAIFCEVQAIPNADWGMMTAPDKLKAAIRKTEK